MTDGEVNFVFEFLYELLKYAQTGEQNSVCLATHLLNDFYELSNGYFNQVLQDCQNQENPATQLLTLNFEMRARKFIEEQSEPDNEDQIFEKLFTVCRNLVQKKQVNQDPETPLTYEMAHDNLPMSVYTASYLK